jgi:hypothetical protein
MSLTLKCEEGSKLHRRLTDMQSQIDPSHDLADLVAIALEKGRITLELLRILGASDKSNLKDLLSDSALEFDAEEKALEAESKATRSKELDKRREYLAKRQQEREYNMMMFGQTVNPEVTREMDRGNSLSSKNNHMAIGANMVMSVLACFAIAYYVGQQTNVGLSTSMIYGLIAAIVILMVEMTLYIMRAIAMEKKYDSPESLNNATKKRRVPASTSGVAIGAAGFPVGKGAGGLITRREVEEIVSKGAAMEQQESKKND